MPRRAMLCCATQAPLELLLGMGWADTCQSDPGAAPRCSLPHLLGFCKLLTWSQVLNPTPASAAAIAPISYSYSYAYGPFAGWACWSLLQSSGAAADLVLWVLLRLQYKLFKSDVYRQVNVSLCQRLHLFRVNFSKLSSVLHQSSLKACAVHLGQKLHERRCNLPMFATGAVPNVQTYITPCQLNLDAANCVAMSRTGGCLHDRGGPH
jgi:hypothetical protein